MYAWLGSLECLGRRRRVALRTLYDFDYVFRQAAHGKPILNGYSGFFPPTYANLEAR